LYETTTVPPKSIEQPEIVTSMVPPAWPPSSLLPESAAPVSVVSAAVVCAESSVELAVGALGSPSDEVDGRGVRLVPAW